MDLEALNAMLGLHNAIIVHCSDPDRGGEECDAQNPPYPEDLRSTIRDLAKGGVRPVSCSVVWPEHQEAFGDVGIILEARQSDHIVDMCVSDAGSMPNLGSRGEHPSEDLLRRTFEEVDGYNEWRLSHADFRGIFVNLAHEPLRVFREISALCLPDDLRSHSGQTVVCEQTIISLDEVAADFPDWPVFGFVDGKLAPVRNLHEVR